MKKIGIKYIYLMVYNFHIHCKHWFHFVFPQIKTVIAGHRIEFQELIWKWNYIASCQTMHLHLLVRASDRKPIENCLLSCVWLKPKILPNAATHSTASGSINLMIRNCYTNESGRDALPSRECECLSALPL